MYVVAACACEQFVVAKKGIEKKSEGGDAEALANIDEAVVLESDTHSQSWMGVRLDCCNPLALPDLSSRVCVHRASGPCFTMQHKMVDWCSSTPWWGWELSWMHRQV